MQELLENCKHKPGKEKERPANLVDGQNKNLNLKVEEVGTCRK